MSTVFFCLHTIKCKKQFYFKQFSLVLCEMLSVSSRIWIRVAVSISYNDNHYTTGTSTKRVDNCLRFLNKVCLLNYEYIVKYFFTCKELPKSLENRWLEIKRLDKWYFHVLCTVMRPITTVIQICTYSNTDGLFRFRYERLYKFWLRSMATRRERHNS